MKVEQTSLPGVLLISPAVHSDDRGFFVESWQERRYKDHGVDGQFVQDNHSGSSRWTLRGIHYQVNSPQGKLVRVVAGEVFDVAVDLRRSSPNFGKWYGTRLSAASKQQLWVPPGFGHGFLTLSEFAEFEYKCTSYYSPADDRCILWDDPQIGIDWPLAAGISPVLSKKDATAPLLAQADLYE